MQYEYRGVNEMQMSLKQIETKRKTILYIANLSDQDKRRLVLNTKLLAIRSWNFDIYDFLCAIEDNPAPHSLMYAIVRLQYITKEVKNEEI